ncbi:MAG: hypothetical protein OXE95_09670 [Chloroflexi bacterium]|nr:hypothetical protein [Chloroflexota bacterium]MCY4247826.1 hypothetical protein [Chloroflexota bacterium]
MADSLFDKRYRYNYIYPRGRSGETLRAVDTFDDDRPVAIKRPHPNDAPPIRAGQEVSIINEREALTRLADHPVLTELLGGGQFFVGGIPQQYIVMERAEGVIIADEVARLAGNQQRLPELEMLEVVGQLINLLQAAHDKDIVYNDVDAKHLFWNRDTYQLKVIDWGNAVFLEGDETTPQGISRQTDIYQLGELLYFLLSGGHRVEAPRVADVEFAVDFHQDADQVDQRLQAIVARAVHPNLRYRYAALAELTTDLLRYRRPLEQRRDELVTRTKEKLKASDLSRNDLLALQTTLQGALRQDPAHPATRKTQGDLVDRLRDLEVSADLDAVRILLSSSNWSGAADLLADLRERAGSKTAALVHLLFDWCLLLIDAPSTSIPGFIGEAAGLLFENKADKAANRLLASGAPNDASRHLQWQLAERISAHVPDVLLLRPNLAQLDESLHQLAIQGIEIDEARASLAGIMQTLDIAKGTSIPGANSLHNACHEIVVSLSALDGGLNLLSQRLALSERRLPLLALSRALDAARALEDNLRIIGQCAASNPRAALNALGGCRAIDPPNSAWDQLEDFMSLLYELLQDSQQFVPAADGADLDAWLSAKHAELQPFAAQLSDKQLADTLAGIESAQAAWAHYRQVVMAGDRAEATAALERAAESLRSLSPKLAGWFGQLRATVESTEYIERHALPGHLGRTLADGWAAFDKSQLADAQRLGQQALEVARSDSEQFIAERLMKLSRSLRDWLERNGIESETRSEAALTEVESLLSKAEARAVEQFENQMPSTETYLKAMGQGLVHSFAASNTAALRILFTQYTLNGVLAAHESALDDARFWQAAAKRCLPSAAAGHSAVGKLDEFIQRRENLLAAQEIFAELRGPSVVDRLGELARQLEENPQAELLTSGLQSLRALEAALADWADAEFRAAGIKLEQVLRYIAEAEANADLQLDNYRAWIMNLQAALAELVIQRRSLSQAIDRQSAEPQPNVREAIHMQADVTEDLLGYQQAQMMLGWRDTYEAFVSIYTGEKRRKAKLEAMDEHFKAMFIDRNPAYSLFRHWYRLVEAQPEEPPEPEEADLPAPPQAATPRIPDIETAPPPSEDIDTAQQAPTRRWLFNLTAIIGIALVVGGLAVLAGNGSFASLLAGLQPEPTATLPPSSTPATTPTSEPTQTPTDTATPEPAPTPLPTIAATPAPSPTAPSIIQPTPILPPGGLTGAQDLLAIYRDAAAASVWDTDRFRQVDNSWLLGAETVAGKATTLSPPADLLEQQYGSQPTARIVGVLAELSLRSSVAALVAEGEVSFGIRLRSLAGDQDAGIQIRQDGSGIISLAQVRDGSPDIISQRTVPNMIARLRLERNDETGEILAYFNDQQIGEPMTNLPADADLLPAIVAADGIVLAVSAWQLELK